MNGSIRNVRAGATTGAERAAVTAGVARHAG